MTGHYDSMPSDVMDPKTDAPGAVDDGSGTSMVLELARLRGPAETIEWSKIIAFGNIDQVVLASVIPDDFTFAVAPVDAEGHESLPQFPATFER